MARGGEWRSLVARLLWEQEAAGSNPVSPTRDGDSALNPQTTPYVSLYRRFRPQRFAEVVGQEEITRTLRNAVVAGEVAHAYLFAGERGIGKTTVARILARAVNCLEPSGGEPCNRCDSCRTVLAGRTLDILEIDGASNRGIDQVRRLRQEVGFAPTDLRVKVYVIDEVHMLTNEAFNALLKTLEEPPPHVVFVFATTEAHKLPRTIISRCQAFDFRRISPEGIAARLREIAEAEEIAAEGDALAMIARRAGGAMRDAIVLLEQAAAFGDGPIDTASLLDMLGLVGEEVHRAFLRSIVEGRRRAVLDTVASLVSRGKDLESFLADLLTLLRDRIAASERVRSRDVALCRGLLEVKARLPRTLDRRIEMEIGLLSLIDALSPGGDEGHPDAPAGAADGDPCDAAAPAVDVDTAVANDETHGAPAAEAEADSHVVESGPVPARQGAERSAPQDAAAPTEGADNAWAARWDALLETIAEERIAVAAFLMEARATLRGERLVLSFSGAHSFQKESLEKPESFQYLAGAVRRGMGEGVRVEIELVEGGDPPADRATLDRKAKLVRDVFDGTIVREER